MRPRHLRSVCVLVSWMALAAAGCDDEGDEKDCAPEPSLEEACKDDEDCKTKRDQAVSHAVELCLESSIQSASLYACPGEEAHTVRLGDGYVGTAYYYDEAGALQGQWAYNDVLGECDVGILGTPSAAECDEQCALCGYDDELDPCTGPETAPLVAACKASKPNVPAELLDCACEQCRVVMAFGKGQEVPGNDDESVSFKVKRCLAQRCGGDDPLADAATGDDDGGEDEDAGGGGAQ